MKYTLKRYDNALALWETCDKGRCSALHFWYKLMMEDWCQRLMIIVNGLATDGIWICEKGVILRDVELNY